MHGQCMGFFLDYFCSSDYGVFPPKEACSLLLGNDAPKGEFDREVNSLLEFKLCVGLGFIFSNFS